jgi:hypothetical protein
MITKSRARWPKWGRAAVLLGVVTLAASGVMSGQDQPHFPQQTLPRGQNVAPAFEGWEKNPDGTFNMVFGYFNRNWEEQPHVPIGPNNAIEPGEPDQGQPTLFFPRRNKFVFRVRVAKDFGNKEVVWTLTSNGKTERAYGTLQPDYNLDLRVLQTNTHMRLAVLDYPEFDKDMLENIAPLVRVEGDTRRTVRVGEPLSLTAFVSDDGRLKPQAAPQGVDSDTTALGLRVAWFVYRGPGDKVTFDPPQFKIYQDKKPGGNSPFSPGWTPPPIPADNKFPVKVIFGTPGAYVVRVLAHDGGLDTAADVTVNVVGASSSTSAASVR